MSCTHFVIGIKMPVLILFFIVKLQIVEENSKNGLFWTFIKRSMNLQQDKKHLTQFIVSPKAIH